MEAYKRVHPKEKVDLTAKQPDWEFTGDEYLAFDAFMRKKVTGVQPTYDEMMSRDLEWDAEIEKMEQVWEWMRLGR